MIVHTETSKLCYYEAKEIVFKKDPFVCNNNNNNALSRAFDEMQERMKN